MRCACLLALTCLIAADAGAAEPTAKEILATCTKSAVTGGVQFACDGVIATVSEFSDASLEMVRTAQLMGMKASIKGDVTTEDATFKAGGKDWAAVRLTVARDKKVVFEGHM